MLDISGPTSIHVFTLLDSGHERSYIEADLVQKGHDDKFVKEFVGECIKLHNAKKRSQGLTLILIGAIICFTSFLLTITSAFTHFSFSMVLYGLTTIGILIVFAGFVKIF